MLEVAPAPTSIVPIREARERLGISRTTLYQMLEDGKIPALRTSPNGRWLISRERFDRWLTHEFGGKG